jgi:hypothetical protein
MTAPQISPMVVDQTRLGGSGSSQRHGFNIASGPRWRTEPAKHPNPAPAPAPPAPQQMILPPPARTLGYGLMQTPKLTESQITEIQGSAAPVVDSLQTLLEGLKLEAQTVTPETLRQHPDAYKGLNELAPYFTPQEYRSQLITDARAIGSDASRMLSGAAAPYLMDTQRQVLETVVDDSKSLVTYLNQFDLAPIEGAKSKLSEDHVKALISEPRQGVSDTEKLIVSMEAGSVPVAEQSTGSPILSTVIALGVLGAIGWLIYEQM